MVTEGQKVHHIPITDGAILKKDAPCWEGHQRGKNWLAIISRDPRAPSGLGRQFMERGHGPYAYMATAPAGSALEFGADYYSGSGRAHRTRVYGVLYEATLDLWVLHEYSTPAATFAAQKEWVAPVPSDVTRRFTFAEEQKEEAHASV